MPHLISFFLLQLLFFLAICPPSSANVIPMADRQMVETICRFNNDPSACINVLSSDPESKTCDLAGLARIALNHAKIVVADTLVYVNNLNASTTDEKLHEIFDTCSSLYSDAEKKVEESMKGLISGAYSAVVDICESAGELATMCEESFRDPPTRTSPLTDRNELVNCLSQIATTVAIMLLHRPSPPNP
ncbi:hypothetical protein ACLOJK_017768 [Asimina triloba]